MTYVLWDVQSKLADHSLQNTHLMNSSIQGKKCDVEVFASFRSVASPRLKKTAENDVLCPAGKNQSNSQR